ncbi:MAG: GIY-YIG nuclease family protein [Cyanobium sp.]
MRPVPLRQGELFGGDGAEPAAADRPAPLPPPLLRHQLLAWQERLDRHQRPLFDGAAAADVAVPADQASLFSPAAGPQPDSQQQALALDPLALQPQSLAFWRWPQAPQQGAAIYLVTDRPAAGEGALLLYVGETGCADRRWKGDHDCKRYLAAYGEALRRADLPTALSIRFWTDVPLAVRPRRALEQALIRRWLPPFNKETRDRWATPFTADPD